MKLVWLALPLLTLAGEVEIVAGLAPRYGARTEVRQWDGSRVDMVTKTHAIEADWAAKWAEAVGQSLYYAQLTGLQPGIILLVRDPKKDAPHVFRCQTVCAKHDVKLWIEPVQDSAEAK